MTPYLISIIALLGQPVSLWTDSGECMGHVVAPGKMIVEDGTCSLSDESAVVELRGETVAWFTRAERLESGRVVAHFVVMP